jgi:hypothetical protein
MHELIEAPQPTNPQPKVHWARKYSQEIGVAFFLLALAFIVLAGYWWAYSEKPRPANYAGVTVGPPLTTIKRPPAPPPAVTPIETPTPTPIATPDLSSQKLIEQPRIQEIPFLTGSEINRGGTLITRVTKIRIINGFTALTFKIDGSANGQQRIAYRRPNNPSIDTLIIDDQGRRYAMVNETPSVAEQPRFAPDSPFYWLEPHESIFVTYLYERLSPDVRSFDVKFSGLINDIGEQPQQIHVVLQ